MTDTPPPSDAARPRGWLRWLLALSLACNLAVAGLVIGAAIRFRDGPPRVFDLSIGPLARALGREDRAWIMRELARSHDLRPRSAEARRAEAAALAAAVRAAPFDAGAFAAALDAMRGRAETLQRAAQDLLVARIASLAPEERAALADRLEAEAAGDPPAVP